MRDHLFDGSVYPRSHKAHRANDVLDFGADDARHREVFRRDARRVHLDRRRQDEADDQVLAAVADHLQALVDGRSRPRRLDDEVGPAPRERSDALDARLRRGVVREIDRLVGAEFAGEREPVGRRADHNRVRRAPRLRLHERPHADGPAPLNDHRVARIRGVDLSQAAHRRVIADDGHQRALRRHIVRDAENCGVRLEQEILAESAAQHRLRCGIDAGVAVVNRVFAAQPHQAVVAVAARRGVEQNAVALAQRLAQRVRPNVRAERGDHAEILVPPHDGAGRVGVMPVVGVRSANRRHAHLHEHIVRPDVGEGELLQLQRALRPDEHRRDAPLGHSEPPARRVGRGAV